MSELKCVVDNKCMLGEGVIWIPEVEVVFWVDIIGERLYKFWPYKNKIESINATPNISAIIPTSLNNNLYIATFADGIKLYDGKRFYAVIDPDITISDKRCNDAFADNFGNLWLGTVDPSFQKRVGYYYCYKSDGSIKRYEESFLVTNGPAFDNRNNYIYLSISEEKKILRGIIDTNGNISNLKLWLKFDETQGLPDGITIDSDSYVWVAHWAGSRISRFTPEGILDKEIYLPVKNVTKCAFGGKDLSTIYITTVSIECSKEELEKYPLSGSLFSIDVDYAKGVSPNKFNLSEDLYSHILL